MRDGGAEGHCRQRHHLHQDKTAKYGLVLNAAKCEVVYRDPLAPHDDDTLKNFQMVELENLTLLGGSGSAWTCNRQSHKTEDREDGEGDFTTTSSPSTRRLDTA